MALSPEQIFILQLGRAGSRAAHSFLRVRGVQSADRDDITQAANLWCWANRSKYSLTTTLETWYMNAVRDAYKDFQRNETPASDESLEFLGGGDDTYDTVAAEDAAASIAKELTSTERRVASLTMRGFTKAEMLKMGLREVDVRESRATIKRLRELLPDESSYSVLIRTAPAAMSDHVDNRPSWIDAAIEQLDFPPHQGEECPPCWRCMWFEGFMPPNKRDTRMEIVDAEVREAVKNTEARKIEIAQQVRA